MTDRNERRGRMLRLIKDLTQMGSPSVGDVADMLRSDRTMSRDLVLTVEASAALCSLPGCADRDGVIVSTADPIAHAEQSRRDGEADGSTEAEIARVIARGTTAVSVTAVDQHRGALASVLLDLEAAKQLVNHLAFAIAHVERLRDEAGR